MSQLLFNHYGLKMNPSYSLWSAYRRTSDRRTDYYSNSNTSMKKANSFRYVGQFKNFTGRKKQLPQNEYLRLII